MAIGKLAFNIQLSDDFELEINDMQIKIIFVSVLAGFVLGLTFNSYYLEMTTLLKGIKLEEALNEVIALERKIDPSSSKKMSEVYLKAAIRRLEGTNPQIKEIISKDLFQKYLIKKRSTELEAIDQEIERSKQKRFDGISTIELIRYKKYMESEAFQKIVKNTTDLAQNSQKQTETIMQRINDLIVQEAESIRAGK